MPHIPPESDPRVALKVVEAIQFIDHAITTAHHKRVIKSYPFGLDVPNDIIHPVFRVLYEHYEKLGYTLRLDTKPIQYHEAKARVRVTSAPMVTPRTYRFRKG